MVNPVGANQSLPKLESPLTDAQGAVNIGWYQLFTYFWRLSAGGKADPTKTVNIAQSAVPGTLDVFNSSHVRIGSLTMGP